MTKFSVSIIVFIVVIELTSANVFDMFRTKNRCGRDEEVSKGCHSACIVKTCANMNPPPNCSKECRENVCDCKSAFRRLTTTSRCIKETRCPNWCRLIQNLCQFESTKKSGLSGGYRKEYLRLHTWISALQQNIKMCSTRSVLEVSTKIF